MPVQTIKRKDLVQVIRPNLKSSGWFGEVQKVYEENNKTKAEVHFRRQNRTLTFNIDGLAKTINPNKKPKEKAKKFIEQEHLVYDESRYLLVIKHNDGFLIDNLNLNLEKVDQEAQVIKYLGRTYNFKDIAYMHKVGQTLRFKRPEENKFPFYILDEDNVVATPVGFTKLNDEVVIRINNGHDMLPEWVDNINLIKPKFKKVRIEVAGDDEDEDFKINKLTRDWNKEAKTRGLSFGLVTKHKKTGVISGEVCYSRACHAQVNTWPGRKDPKTYDYLYGVQLISRDYFKKDDSIIPYMEWVMNRSPWAQYILTKTWEETVDTGIRVRMDIPANAMMCTFYATRYPTEYMERVRNWKKAVDAGMNETAAYFYAETYCLRKNVNSHHTLLNTNSMDMECLHAFIRGDKGKVVTKPLSEGRRYERVSIHHGKSGDVRVTALSEIHKQDIFEGEEMAAFGDGGVKKVSLEKAVVVMNKIAEEANRGK